MRPISIPSLPPTPREALAQLYRPTPTPRVRTRAQMVFLSVAQGLRVAQMAAIVRESEATGLRWRKRYLAEGREGLQDAPRPGRPSESTAAYRAEWLAAVRRRPRSLPVPFSVWTLQRLADYLAERTGWRVSDETVRRALQCEGIVLSRPQPQISRPAPEYAVKKRRVKTPATSGTPRMRSTMRTHSL
jgi:transposase